MRPESMRFMGVYRTELIENTDLNIVVPDGADESYAVPVLAALVAAKKLGFRRLGTNHELGLLLANEVLTRMGLETKIGPLLPSAPAVCLNRPSWPRGPCVHVGWSRSSGAMYLATGEPPGGQDGPGELSLGEQLLATVLLAAGIDALACELGMMRSYRIRRLEFAITVDVYGTLDEDASIFLGSTPIEPQEIVEEGEEGLRKSRITFKVPLRAKELYKRLLELVLPQLVITRKSEPGGHRLRLAVEPWKARGLDELSYVSTAGGIGSYMAFLLSFMPVERLEALLLDRDIVSAENFGPQLYDTSKLNRPKVEALAASMEEWRELALSFGLANGDDLEVETIHADLRDVEDELAKRLEDGPDRYVFLNFDNIEARWRLNKIARERAKGVVNQVSEALYAWAAAMEGEELTFLSEGERGQASCQLIRLDDIGRASPITNLISAAAGLLIAVQRENGLEAREVKYSLDLATRSVFLGAW